MNHLVEDLRKYVVDLKDFNYLNLKQEELLDSQLKTAVLEGAMAYDLIPPISTTDATAITKVLMYGASETAKKWYFIKRFASIEVIQALVFIHIRNRNPVNDHGFTVDEFNKAPEWERMRQILRKEVRDDVREYKRMLEYRGFGVGTSITETLERQAGDLY